MWEIQQRDPGCNVHAGGAILGGCADGTVEVAFNDMVHGCDAQWSAEGLQEGENACADGWHICLDADEASNANGLTVDQCQDTAALSGGTRGLRAGTFYATYQR